MSDRPHEATELHTRLLKCALEVDDSRAYWAHAGEAISPQTAFDEYWFGARSLARVEVLLANMRVRYDAFPAALAVLHDWPHMSPETRRTICHWHLQLADPMYRRFTGTFLVDRRGGPRPQVTRDLALAWVGEHDGDRWTMATRIQFASKLLSASYSAGLVTATRDPRPLAVPRVPDEALGYLMHLLREIEFAGSLLDNPYTRSLGLEGGLLDDRLRGLAGVEYKRQGELVEFDWRYPSLRAWADATLHDPESRVTASGPEFFDPSESRSAGRS